jgi:hypothetical protein
MESVKKNEKVREKECEKETEPCQVTVQKSWAKCPMATTSSVVA